MLALRGADCCPSADSYLADLEKYELTELSVENMKTTDSMYELDTEARLVAVSASEDLEA